MFRRRKPRCGCDGCPDCPPTQVDTSSAVARHNSTTARFTVERGADMPGAFERSFDRNYDVQAFTGYPTSSVPAGRWNRGVLYRQAMPTLRLTSMGPMFDRSDPRTWPNRVG